MPRPDLTAWAKAHPMNCKERVRNAVLAANSPAELLAALKSFAAK